MHILIKGRSIETDKKTLHLISLRKGREKFFIEGNDCWLINFLLQIRGGMGKKKGIELLLTAIDAFNIVIQLSPGSISPIQAVNKHRFSGIRACNKAIQ